MSQEKWTSVDAYFNDLLMPPNKHLEAALTASDAADLVPHAVAQNQGKLLMLLAQMQGARTVLEIGTLGGYSTIWLASGMPKDGRIVTLEVDSSYAEVARTNVKNAGFAEQVEVRVGPATESLNALIEAEHPPFDLIFIDADKPNNPIYFAGALKLSRPGTIIIADNVVRDGEVVNAASDDLRVQGVQKFTEMVAAEPRVHATALQTVGEKGYDGFMLIRVID